MSRSLGSLRIDLVALTGKFEANFRSATTVLNKFGVTATKIGSVATGAIARMSGAFSSIKNSILSVQGIMTGLIAVIGGARFIGAFDNAAEAVDNLGKKARIVGLSVEQMSVLRLAAGESGVEFETLSKLVGKATKNIGAFAATGGGPAASAIRRLGVNVKAAGGGMRDINSLLPEIASAFERIGDEGERLSLSEAIFGREGGQQFIQWLEDSGGFMANLAEQTDRATKLGVLFSERQFVRLKAYRDAVGRISEAWLGLRVRVMTELAPALEGLANRLALRLARIGEFSANLASVLVAGFEKRDMRGGTNEEQVNFAFAVAKELVSKFFRALWTEVSTRIQFFFSQVWEFVKIVAADLFGKVGTFFTDAAEGATGFLGEMFANIATMLGDVFSKLADELKYLGAYFADKWAVAGENLKAYGVELENTRKAHWTLFGMEIDNVDQLGRKYREAREAEEGFRSSLAKTTSTVSALSTAWGDFFDGMRQEWQRLTDEAADMAALGRNVFGALATGVSTQLASALASGEASFKNFGNVAIGVLADVAKGISEMLLQWMFMRAITGAFGGFFGAPTGGGGAAAPQVGNMSSFYATPSAYAAKGGVFGFAKGGIASGVLNGPTAFPFSSKVGVAGEAGDEVGFAPLRRIGGELGVAATGGDVMVQIVDQRGSGARPEVSSSRGDDGKKTIRILIRDEVRRGIGEGEFDKVLGSNFGLGRKGTKR